MQAHQLFDLPPSLKGFEAFFDPEAEPWDWVKAIGGALEGVDLTLSPVDVPQGVSIEGKVYLHPSVKLPPYARLEGPAWIGPEVEIRPGAFVRGNVIVGAGCVLGNACEYKNCLLLENVQTPHYNYVGDSILGNGAHLGAGVICSNLRLDQAEVNVHTPQGRVPTGMRKLGALLGDGAEVGCNSALQPGTILDKHALVGPVVAFSGYVPPWHVALSKNEVMTRPDRP